MQLTPGSTLLHYRIGELLGQGGMGAVYRAEDTKLGRQVAIKVLPAEFSTNEERLARFDREARLLAALNHPHIATIHGVENVNGVRLIVMEHVTGETLADHLSRGAIPVDEAIAIARQIAAALEAAHEKGVIHRDLKPGNIIINDDGRVKVLDFGLARSVGPDSIETDVLNSPTIPHAGTHTGVILGTAGYMSPEQARGKKVDRRADVWAFGVVLFEMLTGRRLFAGESVSDTLAAILTQEPDWNALPAATPPNVRRLLRRCLAKKPADRMHDFGDVLLELNEVESGAPPTSAAVQRRSLLPWAVTALALAVASFALWRAKEPSAPPRLMKTIVSTEMEHGWNFVPAISPDGRRVAYAAAGALWIRSLDELEPRKIPLTGSRQPVLFWSPDSQWVVFVSGEKIWKIAPGGSAPVPIAAIPFVEGGARLFFHSGAWGADDRIVLSRFKGGLYELSVRGGAPREFLPPDGKLVDFHSLSFLPDGKTLLAVPHEMDNRLTVEVIRGTERQTVFTWPQGLLHGVAYSPTGHLLVGMGSIDSGVWAVPFSADTLKTTGKPFLVAALAGGCSVSSDGSLVYAANVDYAPRQLVRIDRSGKGTTKIGEPIDGLSLPVMSDDERTVAFTARDSEHNLTVSVLDLESGSRRQITRGDVVDHTMMFSRDGRRLLMHRDPDGAWSGPQYGLWVIPLDGSGEPRRIVPAFHGRFTSDEKSVVFTTVVPRDASNIATVPVDGSAKPVEFIRSPNPKLTVMPSPDGRLVAYQSIESGTSEIYVASYPDGGGRWQASRGTASVPRWSHDGRTLYFISGNKLMSVPVSPPAPPTLIFDATALDASLNYGYQVLRDGSVLATADLPADKKQVVLVQNWLAEF